MSEKIDAIIAAAANAAPENAQPQTDADSTKTEELETESTSSEEVSSKDSDISSESEETPKEEEQPFPKKAVNAIARHKSDKFKLRMRVKELESRLNEYEKRGTELKQQAPKEADFEGKPYEELMDAKISHTADLKHNEMQARLAAEERARIQEEIRAERDKAVAESVAEAKKQFPDFEKTLRQHSAAIDALPAEIADVIMETEKSPQALYSIIKDGLFDEFSILSPYEAAQMLAEHRGKIKQMARGRTITNAPDPITPARGVGLGAKTVERMSPKELLGLVRSS